MIVGDRVTLGVDLPVMRPDGSVWYTIERNSVGVIVDQLGDRFFSVQFGEGNPHITVPCGMLWTVPKPLQQLPHVRVFDTPTGSYTVSMIGLGYEARHLGRPLTDCPFGADDPDGVCWWMMGWHRGDLHEVRHGRPSLWKPERK